jgi:hypothetical protein
MNPVEAFLQEKTAGAMGEVAEGAAKRAPGFLKSLLEGLRSGEPTLDTAGQRFGYNLGGNLQTAAVIGSAGLALDAGIRGARQMVNFGVDKVKKPMEYKAMIEAHPELQKEDAGRVQAYYNSLRHMSPHMAADPVIAGSFVRNLLDRGPEGSPAVPMETANMLAGIQKSVSGVQKDRGLLPSQSPVVGMLTKQLPQINPGDVPQGGGSKGGERMYGKG